MKKILFLVSAACISGAGLTGCSKSKEPGTVEPPHVKAVYAAGYYNNAGKTYSTIWKDGIASVFDSSAAPTDVFVNGSDLFVCGQKNSKAIFWKNGVGTLLTSDPAYGYVITSSIHVSGSDVHIAGMAENATTYRKQAIYWKKNVPVLLNPGANAEDSYAYSVALSGSDVYVAGFKTLTGGGSAVVIWKNGIASDLISSPSTDYGNINLFVSGTDIYVTCYEYNSPNPEQIRLWKNGTAVSFPSSVLGAAPFCLFVNGTDVYIGGFEREGTPSNTNAVARYWKNGIPVSLADSPNGADIIKSIYVDGTDVYAAGTTGTLVSTSTPTVWKNGANYPLTGTTQIGEIRSIYVK